MLFDVGFMAIIKSTIFATLIMLGSLGWGGFIVQINRSFALQTILRIAIGLFLFSLWVFVFGHFGLLNLIGLIPFIAIGIFLIFLRFEEYQLVIVQGVKGVHHWSSLDKFICFIFLCLSGISYIAIHSPAIGNDTLAYHLYFPIQYAREGQIFYDQMHHRSLWPAMMGMLYSAGLTLQGVQLAKFFSWVTAVLGIVSVPAVVWAISKNIIITRLSFILMMCIPALWMQSLYAYVDNAIMFYSFLLMVMVWLWRLAGYSNKKGVAIGLLTAALVTIKLNALIVAAIIYSLTLIYIIKDLKDMRVIAKKITVPIFFGALFSCVWFLKSWYLLGNPVFPFLPDWFGGMGFSQRMLGYSIFPKNLINLVLLPWNITYSFDVFGGETLGILLLILVPCSFSFIKLKGFARFCALFTIFYILSWYYSLQLTRFLFVALPALCIALAYVLNSEPWRRALNQRIFKLIIGAVVTLQILICAYYPAKMMPVAIGIKSAHEYLNERDRSYAFMSEVKAYLKPGHKLISFGEPRLIYMAMPVIFYNPKLGLLAKRERVTLSDFLVRNGATHILTRGREGRKVLPESFLTNGDQLNLHYKEVISRSIERDGIDSFYTLWKISDQD